MQTKQFLTILAVALGLGLTLALLAGLQTAQAAPATPDRFVTPTGGGDCSQASPCALQTALGLAVNGDTIYVAGGVYTGTGSEVIAVTQSITLAGGWDGATGGRVVRDPAAYPTTLDGEWARRVVYISGNITPTLDGFIVTRGNATGLLTGCPGNPDGCGGGVFVISAHPLIVNNTITNNVAAITTTGNPTVAIGFGGGLYLNDATRAVISGNLIISNVASLASRGYGGGIHLEGILFGAQVQFNQVLSNAATTKNAVGYGGGISGGPGGVVIRGNSVIGNRANGYGGGEGAGLYQWFGSATYLNNLVTGNLGSAGSQAVYLGYSASHFESNRVVDNATSQGIKFQGVFWGSSGPTLVNNIVARSGDRTLSLHGGMGWPLTTTLLHNTLVGSGSGTGVYVATGYIALFLTNTIVVDHTWGITNTFPASSTVLADHTLFWANTHDGIRGANPVDGTPTFATDGYHIGSGCSAAIDAGVSAGVTTDIDGEARPYGPGYDIGADELSTGLACWRVYLPLASRNYP